MRRSAPVRMTMATVVVVTATLAVACAPAGTAGRPASGPSTSPAADGPAVPAGDASSPLASPAPVAPAVAATIPQPEPPEGLTLAPATARVDVAMPNFSDPTRITNPLFPISRQESVLMLGRVDDKPFRTEVTLLPFTRVIDWAGQRVETLVSQYAAYSDGRLDEIAYDFYAQADDGSVWYFGEDVFDFRDGSIVTTEGTWLAGKDGPAAMIMPGRPRVGDVYRPENVPGFVFEEVTVKGVDQIVDGPLGPVAGGLSISELHADGSRETKLFAPGYGEYRTGSAGGDVEAMALAVPADAMDGPVPGALSTLTETALAAFDHAAAERWSRLGTSLAELRRAHDAIADATVPPAVAADLATGLRRLDAAIEARRPDRAQNAAIAIARSGYDLQLRYRPATEIDAARFDLWAAQVLVDVERRDANGVIASVFALDYLRDRFLHTLEPSLATGINLRLTDLQSAVKDDDLATSASAAKELRTLLAGQR